MFLKANGTVEAVLLKGAKSKSRKSNLLSGLVGIMTGLKDEEQNLKDVRSEMSLIMADLQAEDELLVKELESISVVRSNIEKLLGK